MSKVAKELLVKEQIVQEQPGMEQPGMSESNHVQALAGNSPKEQAGRKIGAGFSGVVVGTAMTFLASRIDESETRKFVLLSIPTVTVTGAELSHRLLLWSQGPLLDLRIAYKRWRLRQSTLGILKDPMSSEDRKEQARKNWEKSDDMARQDDMNSLASLLKAKKNLTNQA